MKEVLIMWEYRNVILLICLISSLVIPVIGGPKNLSVTFNVDKKSSNFGAITKIVDKTQDAYVNNGIWFVPKIDGKFSRHKEVISHSESHLSVVYRNFNDIPLSVELTYRIHENTIDCEVKAYVTEKTEFPKGIYLDFSHSYSKLTTYNHTLQSNHYNLNKQKDISVIFENGLHFSNGPHTFVVLMRNTTHSIWEINSGKINDNRLWILPTLPPHGPYGEVPQVGPLLASTLTPNDTIVRNIELYTKSKSIEPLYFSEFPNGHSQGFTMFWDELPSYIDVGNGWTSMSTADADDTKYEKYFVKLMEKHQKLKMGYLYGIDLLLVRYNSKFSDWKVSSPYILADSLESPQGKWAILFANNSEHTLELSQNFNLQNSGDKKLRFRSKNMKGHRGEPLSVSILDPNGESVFWTKLSENKEKWKEYTFSFTPKVTGKHQIVFASVHNSGMILLDDVKLTEENGSSNSITNGSFEHNSPKFCYDNTRRHWMDAHGRYYLLTAPQKYRDFLMRIEQDDMRYGWEDRVRLGIHAYHHTPSLFEPDNHYPGWEFQYVDEMGDSLRVHKLYEDSRKIGLTDKSFRFIRFPGGKYTKHSIDRFIDSGMVYLDISHLRLKHVPKYNKFMAKFIQRGKNRMWGTSQCWWADQFLNQPISYIHDVMKRGHLAQIGGHTNEMFKDMNSRDSEECEGCGYSCSYDHGGNYSHKRTRFVESGYERMDRIFTTLEKEYPNMTYLFPDEYSDNCNAMYELKLTANLKTDTYDYTLEGAIKKGVSLAFMGTCDNAFLNGKTLDRKEVDGRTYIVLPNTPFGKHRLEIVRPILASAISNFDKVHTKQIVSTVMKNRILLQIPEQYARVNIELYNVQGKILYKKDISKEEFIGKKMFINTQKYGKQMLFLRATWTTLFNQKGRWVKKFAM